MCTADTGAATQPTATDAPSVAPATLVATSLAPSLASSTLGPIRCTLCVKGTLDPGGRQRTKSTLSPERVQS